MKYVLAMIAALALSAPAFAQDAETSPDGRRVRIEVKDGTVIVRAGEETEETGEAEESESIEIHRKIEEILKRTGEEADDAELPQDIQDMLKRFREQMEEMRKEMEERMKEMLGKIENATDDLESDPDAEVEESEYTSPDGKTHVKIKIVRIRKIVKSGETPEAPETPEKETERKQ
jgi:ElaB/YqjD/DUF883 family membrane-anchored ribosome-binding protein